MLLLLDIAFSCIHLLFSGSCQNGVCVCVRVRANLKRDNDRKQGTITTIGSTYLTKSSLPKSMQPAIYRIAGYFHAGQNIAKFSLG